MSILVATLAALLSLPPAEIVVDRDNVEIAATGPVRVRIAAAVIADADGNGVIHITGDGAIVDFEGAVLNGAESSREPDAYAGCGVRITADRVTLRNARVSGFRVGIGASGADDLVIESCDVSGNFGQRLRSTRAAEATEDWLWPHANDDGEWITRYGAGLSLERCSRATVSGVRARDVQNGIVLDRVGDSKVYDNDCSFLSGWGLAMWRSSRNVVSRNAFDFCVRGYSHDVYNRGQDSAGILMFEQCCGNVIAENSVTHGGDGLFGFAGREALGETTPDADPELHRRRGNNDNLIIANDFSCAAAHGIEMTFSFGNKIYGNVIEGNAICGIWGGYSHETHIAGNVIASNGDCAHGFERGGIDIEHGVGNRIEGNDFRSNAVDIFLWWDADEGVAATPWARANGTRCDGNVIEWNSFGNDAGIELRHTNGTTSIGRNLFSGQLEPAVADGTDPVWLSRAGDSPVERLGPRPDDEAAMRAAMAWLELPHRVFLRGERDEESRPPVEYPCFGETTPIGAREQLRGRSHILMTEWGPHDYERAMYVLEPPGLDDAGRPAIVVRYLPALRAEVDEPLRFAWQCDSRALQAEGLEPSIQEPSGRSMRFTALAPGIHSLRFSYGESSPSEHALTTNLVAARWRVVHFRSAVDPRDDVGRWRQDGDVALLIKRTMLDLRFGSSGPEIDGSVVVDHFGTIATTKLLWPAGRWRIRTTSDDGIRVWLDSALVIDDWTWHAPKEHVHEFEVAEAREIEIRIEHFELDGYAVLSLAVEAAP